MKKLLSMLLAVLMLATMALGTVSASAEEAAPTTATAWLLYFASNHEKDSANFPWWPQHQRVDQPSSETGVEATNAQITGPGKYTVGLKFNWQKAEGAIQFNLIINDAEVLFPGYYVDITDIRVNGESIPMNENYYGTYHDDTNSGMVPLYNSYWDPFFTPDAVGPQNYRSFDGTPEDATHMVINPDDIVNGDTIENNIPTPGRRGFGFGRRVEYKSFPVEQGKDYDIVLGGGFISCRDPGYMPAGEVNYGLLQSLLPFDNQLTLCSIKGRDLVNKFLETDHYSYFIHCTTYGESIRNQVDPEATYYVVTDSFSAYYAPNNMTVIDTYAEDVYARDLLADYMAQGGLE